MSSVGNDSEDMMFVVVSITWYLDFIHQIYDNVNWVCFVTASVWMYIGSASLLQVSGCTCSVRCLPTKLFSITGSSPSVGYSTNQ